MKRLLIYFLLSMVMHTAHAQRTMELQVPTTCNTAKKMCEVGDESYNLLGNEHYCTQPFYYSFYQASVATNVLGFGSEGSGGVLALYHSSSNTICDEVNLNTATLVGTATFGTYQSVYIPFNQAGYYILQVIHDSCFINTTHWEIPVPALFFGIALQSMEAISCPDPTPEEPEEPRTDTCKDCITSFSPNAGKYMVSAWVSEDAGTNTLTYTNVSLRVSFSGDPPILTEYTLLPSGRIIDGWQRIESVIEIPTDATDIHLTLQTSSGTAYFDDIRFYPLDGSMVSYVYDPINLRLMAQLDERNYATFYEYDEEGKLIRVKKETERGVMTIQENRDNIKKQ